MTKVGAEASLSLLRNQTDLSRLKIGAELIVKVKGPTRHGLVVQMGSSPLFLNARGIPQDAKSLTLKITESASGPNRKVQVMASDHQPLAKAVQGELSLKPPATAAKDVSSTSAESHRIDVKVRPVTSDGRHLGAALTIRLTTTPNPKGSEAGQIERGFATSRLPDQISVAKPTASPIPGIIAPPSSSSPAARRMTLPQQGGSVSAGAAFRLDAGSVPVSPVDHALNGFYVNGSSAAAMSAKDSNPAKAIPSLPFWHQPDGQGVVQATVIGRGLDRGQLLLQITDDLLLQVEDTVDLPIGTTLQITTMTGLPMIGQPLDAGSPVSKSSLLSKLVELLDDIERSRMSSEGPRPSAALPQRPMPDRFLAARLLQLIALQMGPVSSEADMVAEAQESNEFLKTRQVQNLLVDINGRASESLEDGWRSTMLPIGQDPVETLMIRYREHDLDRETSGDETGADDDRAQRAIFDINFCHLGRCQIDVLCRNRQFDLLVRSEGKLGQDHQQEITDLYNSACEIAGLAGEIGFRHGQFVEPALASRTTTGLTA